ncbi:type II toxin-antitoxin system RelE/ParE family toxin [Woodsholea maritima]|uniref:type II toxin-antitoxin system RelE/ParE family toxin n=1 Tax=Woodsholea maritima TaxID=240237 RepID=UPI00037A9D6B|nr:type II toxin-antitoxin system RelE/ParE family toxin [Woodsholea maritima]
MLELVITKPAERHLEAIAAWTIKHWGQAQLETYKGGLENALVALMNNPHIGQNASDVRIGYRKYFIQDYWIYYEVTREAVIVHAFLHGRQNPSEHL